MTKSQGLVLQSDSHKKKKLKLNVEEITYVQDEKKEEMNGKKKNKKRKAEDEVLETSTQLNGDHEENKRKKKKKKSEVCVPVESITEEPQDTEPMEETHKQEDHTKKKKKKKQKQDSEAVVPESDPVTPQEEETNTHTAKEKKQKKRKKSAAESSGDVNTSVQQEPSGVEDENGLDGEEELSPEERRVLERKLKKIMKKEEKRKLKEKGKSTNPEKVKTSVAETQALEYLTCWSKKREAWKFNKSRQTWLLQNMYDSVKVSDDHFEMLLPYIDGLQGLARSSTLQKAEAIVRWEGQGEEADTADAEKKQQRAKQVVQML
ncbi:uncharacterized protein C7orf50 [Pimephales promelas]|uniref:uncharacterized protein C7orf50 n=1 Tax=Pimephales promelas TaxID=90988 RepID=UPI001955D92B|nr:uncharacterized protein C7orf50 [Pimephales promelas]